MGMLRLGLSVSKRVGTAVKRNRVRRHLKEIFRPSTRRLESLDLVISARPGAAEASFGELNEEFLRFLSKLNNSVAEESRECS